MGEVVVGVGGRCRAVFVILVVGIVCLGEWHKLNCKSDQEYT